MKPVVVIPTYNERENVEAMAAAVLANLPPEGRLLFLDDNSPPRRQLAGRHGRGD